MHHCSDCRHDRPACAAGSSFSRPACGSPTASKWRPAAAAAAIRRDAHDDEPPLGDVGLDSRQVEARIEAQPGEHVQRGIEKNEQPQQPPEFDQPAQPRQEYAQGRNREPPGQHPKRRQPGDRCNLRRRIRPKRVGDRLIDRRRKRQQTPNPHQRFKTIKVERFMVSFKRYGRASETESEKVSFCPLFPCSLVPSFPCSLVPSFPCFLVPSFPCSLVPLFPAIPFPNPCSCLKNSSTNSSRYTLMQPARRIR